MSASSDTRGLPPFSGCASGCPKCGAEAKARWHPHGGRSGYPCSIYLSSHWRSVGEHMCRTCPGCGYGWMEATKDATAGVSGGG
jgi:hypothetical protein